MLPPSATNSHGGPHYDAFALPCQRSAVTLRTTRESTLPLSERVASHGSRVGPTGDWSAEAQWIFHTAVGMTSAEGWTHDNVVAALEQARREAAAQRTLYAVACTRLFGWAPPWSHRWNFPHSRLLVYP